MSTAYDRIVARKLAEKQARQRAMPPKKVAQVLLREWLGKQGFGGVMDPFAAASLVEFVEAAIAAERTLSTSNQTVKP